MCATMQQFDKAASLFEEVWVDPQEFWPLPFSSCHCVLPFSQIGRNSLENTLLKYGAKDYFFKASICLFCKGPAEAKVCDCVHFHLCMEHGSPSTKWPFSYMLEDHFPCSLKKKKKNIFHSLEDHFLLARGQFLSLARKSFLLSYFDLGSKV